MSQARSGGSVSSNIDLIFTLPTIHYCIRACVRSNRFVNRDFLRCNDG